MNTNLILVIIYACYCDYLRKYDSKVPYNYNKKELRPFVGILFEINNFKYFAPLSSPKPKYLKMRNTIDFFKLDNGKLGAVNFNNMLPVQYNNIIPLNLNREYLSAKDAKYQKLLKEQIYWLNRNLEKINLKLKNLYDSYCNKKLNINIYNRCCAFKLLEKNATNIINSVNYKNI